MKLLLVSLLLCTQVFAGYRVYQLKVDYYAPDGKVEKSETVMSQLDHLQYEHWHGGYGNSLVTYIDSWYCPGDTSRKEYCEKPRESEIVRGPAAYNRDKRIPVNLQPVIP